MNTVAVLGGSGMLGSMAVDVLSRDSQFHVVATVRTERLAERGRQLLPNVDWRTLDLTRGANGSLPDVLAGSQWIINAIGVTKPYVHDDNPSEIQNALRINSLFPYELAAAAQQCGARILQIATDCVFSGKLGGYPETASHDPLDVYGKTKSLGEVSSPGTYCLRCSIIGPEARAFHFLFEWLRHQDRGAAVNGFTNHRWNGVTTLHFARLCKGVIAENLSLNRLQHVVPCDAVSKHELLSLCQRVLAAGEIAIVPVEAESAIDRTLTTIDDAANRRLWRAAGYREPPEIGRMIAELVGFDYRLQGAWA